MGSVESSPPGHGKGGEAGVESGRFEGPLSIDDAERFAAAFRPSWEFDEAPFAPGPVLSPVEFQSLSASEHPRAMPDPAEAEVPLVARSVAPRAPPSRHDAAPASDEASVIVQPPAPVNAPQVASALVPAPLDMAPPPRVAAGLGLPATAPRYSSAPSPASLASTVTNATFPRNSASVRPAFDSMAPVTPKKSKAPLLVGGALVVVVAAFFVYRAASSDDDATPAGGSATPTTAAAAASTYGSGGSGAGTAAAAGTSTGSSTTSPEDLAAALGTRPAATAVATVVKPAAPPAPPPPPRLPPPTHAAPPVVHAAPVQRVAPAVHETPKSPPKPSGGGIVRDVPF